MDCIRLEGDSEVSEFLLILFVFENNENKVMFNNTVKTTRGTLKIPYVQN